MGSWDYKFLNPGIEDWEFNPGIAITTDDTNADSDIQYLLFDTLTYPYCSY